MKFKSPKLKCKNCDDVIFSKYPGEYVLCKCNVESCNLERNLFEDLKEYIAEDNEHTVKCILHKHLNKGIMIDATIHYVRYAGGFEVIEEGNTNDKQS